MTEQKSDRQEAPSPGGLQRLVRNIVEDLMSHETSPCEETVASSPVNRFGSVNDEINNMFRIPRGHSNMSSTSASQTTIAGNFNSRQNYSRNQTQRKRPGSRQTPTQPRKRQQNQSSDAAFKYIKDVFLLPSPAWATVPRKEKKVFLQTHNFAVDAFLIDKRWNSEQLKKEFSQLFSTALMNDTPEVSESIGYVFV